MVFKRILLTTMLASMLAFGQEALRKAHFNLDKGVAVQGYDVVSYFKQRKAMEGKKSLALNYAGVLYYFSSEEHREDFKKAPQNYEPQFGGWCAYAMGSAGEKVEVDPETFKIVGGKLYLFYNQYFNNTLKSWNQNEVSLQQKAEANWKTLYK